MANTQLITNQSREDKQPEEEKEELSQECKELWASLPKEKGWRTPNLYLFQGFWCQPKEIQAIISVQKHFRPQDSDIILATIPKSGTTWLKALAFAIVNRRRFRVFDNNHALFTCNPHELVPFLEYQVYANGQIPDLSSLPSPRLFASHVPFGGLPEVVRESNCLLVYLCRNPFDTFVSIWHYLTKLRPESLGPLSLEEAFDMYCRGVIGYGPYWDHILGYWKVSLEKPNKVLFLKYEDMKEDINTHLKMLADFFGCPFSMEEINSGVVEDIAELCSFQNLKELEVNKNGKAVADFENKYLFRKAAVGDWVNLLTPLMVERLSKIMEEKLGGSGLLFKLFVEKNN